MTERKNAGYNICNDFVLTSHKTDNSLRTNGKTRFFFLFIFFFGGRGGGGYKVPWNGVRPMLLGQVLDQVV